MEQLTRKSMAASVFASLAAAIAPTADIAAQPESQAPLEEITVTGSRIRASSGMNTPVPVTMMTAEEMDFSAPGALINALDRMPQFLGSSRPGVGQGIGTTAGQSIVNMRGIGSTRP